MSDNPFASVTPQTGDPTLVPFGPVGPVDQMAASPVPGPPVTSAPVAQTPKPQLLEGDVLLTDGRVVKVMETSPDHDFMVRRLLTQCGVTLNGLGAMDYSSYMALCAIESVGRLDTASGRVVDRLPAAVPMTQLMLDERRGLPGTTKNLNRILSVYQDLNGLGDENDPFRG